MRIIQVMCWQGFVLDRPGSSVRGGLQPGRQHNKNLQRNDLIFLLNTGFFLEAVLYLLNVSVSLLRIMIDYILSFSYHAPNLVLLL